MHGTCVRPTWLEDSPGCRTPDNQPRMSFIAKRWRLRGPAAGSAEEFRVAKRSIATI
jgi:hypothetical protein